MDHVYLLVVDHHMISPRLHQTLYQVRIPMKRRIMQWRKPITTAIKKLLIFPNILEFGEQARYIIIVCCGFGWLI